MMDDVQNTNREGQDEGGVAGSLVGGVSKGKSSPPSGSTVSSASSVASKSPVVSILAVVIIVLLVVVGYFVFIKDGGGSSSNLPTKMSTSVEGFDVKTDIAYSTSELYNADVMPDGELWIYGYYDDSSYYTSLLETPTDEYGGMMIDITNADGADSVSNGDLVLVGGEYDDEGFAFLVDSIAVITDKDIEVFNTYKYPYAEITILDAPKTVTHGCEPIKMKVRIKNIGRIPLRESDFYTYSTTLPKYNFIQITDGAEDGGYGYNEETKKVAQQGYLNFEDIRPGETKEFTYAAGGSVEKVSAGISGDPNTMCSPDFSFPGGDREVKLAIGYLAPGSYTEYILTSVSNPVILNVLDCKCDLTAVD